MSGKLWSILLIIFLIFTIAGSIVDATGGVNVTRLNGALSSSATTVTVTSTAGFNSANDYIQIDNEYIYYTAVTATTFGTGGAPVTRGYDPVGMPESTAATHLTNAKVMSPDSAILNNILGFNIMSMSTSSGQLDMPTIFWKAITITLPKLVLADFSIYDRPPLLYLRYVHQLISLGVFIPLAIQIVLAGISAVTNFFRLLG